MDEILKLKEVQQASEDFRFLLNRGYPRKATLQLIGNRYGLNFNERHLLHRGVFSNTDSKARRMKKIPIHEVRDRDLAIDGHNVLITIEAGLSGRPLIYGDDGFVRDISGVSGSFKRTETTEKAIELLIDGLKKMKPHHTLFVLDAPISMSGKLAQEVRNRLKRENLVGDAMALRIPEKVLIGFLGAVATSDTAIIDQSNKVVDLAGYILKKNNKLKSLIRLRRKRGTLGKK